MNPEQARNVMNAFLEIRDKLADAARDRAQMQHELDTLWWLVALNILLQVLWIGIKVWLDVRYERRFRILTRLAGEHGETTDRQKERTAQARDEIVEVGQTLVRAGDTASRLAVVAADKADQATRHMHAALGRMAAEVHEVRETGERTHGLVNSAMSAQLKLTAAFARRVADVTDDPADRQTADAAELAYRDHAAKLANGGNT